jgi:hypothetical protein
MTPGMRFLARKIMPEPVKQRWKQGYPTKAFRRITRWGLRNLGWRESKLVVTKITWDHSRLCSRRITRLKVLFVRVSSLEEREWVASNWRFFEMSDTNRLPH